MRISDVAEAQGGIVLSRKEEKKPMDGSYMYKRLSLRSLNESGYIDKAELDDFYASEQLRNVLFTKNNDVAVRLSYPLFPTLITSGSEGLLVPSQIAVLRIKDKEKITPGYLRLCLAQKKVLERVQDIEYGTTQRTIKISTVLDLDIFVPDLETQAKAVEIDELSRRRETLYRTLIEQERSLTSGIIERIIGGTL